MIRLPPAMFVPLLLLVGGCATPAAESEFFGKVEPPEGQVLRYISGSEPKPWILNSDRITRSSHLNGAV